MARPPLYKSRPDLLPKLLSALRGGASELQAAQIAGVGWETVCRWKDEDGELRRQVDEAQAVARAGGLVVTRPTREPAAKPAGRWERVREEAAKLGPGLYGCLLWLEARIAEHNSKAPPWDQLPPMPAPILGIFAAFFASGKQELVVRGGRGLGKSTVFSRPSLVECLFAPRVVNAGEVAVWAELSTDMDEANFKVGVFKRLLLLAGFREGDPDQPNEFKVMRAERGRSRIQFINAEHERVEIRVYPATVKALSGPTLKGARHDEEAKWKHDAKNETNSAAEVLDAEAGAFRGRPHAHLYRVSSAWTTGGPHYDDVEAGDTAQRMVARIGAAFLDLTRAGFEARAEVSTPEDAAEIRAYAASLTADSPNLPSWFNPSLDPRTLKARNVRVFLREYGSKSSGSADEGDFFDGILLDAAEARARPRGEPDATFAAIDTGAKRNPAALAIVGRWDTDEGQRFAPLLLRAWTPAPGRPLDLRLSVLPAMATLTKRHGADGWSSDGFASDQIDLVAGAHGLTVTYVATSEAFRDVYGPVAAGLAREEVCLSGCEGAPEAATQLRRVSSEAELSGVGARVRMIVPEDVGGEHGDLGVALVRALAAAGCGAVEAADDGGAVGTPSRYAAEFRRRVA